MLLAPYVCFHIFSLVKVTEWPPSGENSCSFGLRYVSWYKYLIVSLFFSHLGFWSGNLFSSSLPTCTFLSENTGLRTVGNCILLTALYF